jgi:hypothetical protein
MYNKKVIMGPLDNVVFGKKKFSDILQEIYNTKKTRENQVMTLITELQPLVKEVGDATLLVPLIKDYLEIAVKNDDQLIKMATIVQRVFNSSTTEGNLTISEDEKKQLMDEIHKINNK